ncbi:MAG: LysR family transcriptional regulator [Pseudomonadota bacterium]
MSSEAMQPPLDWAHVQFFLAVAEGGSIHGAAQRLSVNHSTVLRRIAALERQLGCRLFDRLPGGYALTAAGNNLAEHLAGLTEQLESAERQVRGLDAALRGPVRVTSSDIVVEGLLMPLLAQFRRRHLQVQVQLVMNYGFAALSKSEADVAVRGADEAPPNLVAQRVGHVESVLCASPSYLQSVGRQQPLDRHRWVVVDESLSFGMFDRWLREHVPPDRVVVRVDSLVGVADAVAHGLGVGVLPRPLIAARPGLVPLGPPEPRLQKPIWVLMHPDVQRTARVRALFEFLVEALAADPNLAH